MCGIFGAVQNKLRPLDTISGFSGQGLSKLRHRGPDGDGLDVLTESGWVDVHAASERDPVSAVLGHTRLAILDLSSAGRQPMHSPDRRVAITFNGEIYNYVELRAELIGLGYSFGSGSDSEVVLKSWMEWGVAAIDRWVGMFAVAIYDARVQSMYLVRDPFGIKPLYYCDAVSGCLAFASEPAVLLEHSGVSRHVNVAKGTRYLLHGDYDSDDGTMLRDVKQVRPGQYVRWDIDASRVADVQAYWEPSIDTTWKGSFADAVSRFREMLIDSVELHLRSDVPFGVALSGGLDSSTLVCCVRHIAPDIDLNTFSFIDDGEKSEFDWIRKVEATARTIPHHVSIGRHDLDEAFDDFVLTLGEPVGGSSVFAHFKVAELTRGRGVTVSLEGQGADELLGGYHGYSGLRLSAMLRKLELHKAVPFAVRSSKWPGRSYRKIIRECLKDLGVSRSNQPQEMPAWLDKEVVGAAFASAQFLGHKSHDSSGAERLKNQLRFQLLELGLPGMMRHGDRTSMKFSVESRVPFLTRPIADFLYSLPDEYLVDNRGTSKAILRAAMRGIVPDEVLDRRDKVGFATSEEAWMLRRRDWVRDILSRADAVSFVNEQEILAHWDRIVSGKARYTSLIWRWINYVRWVELLNLSA